MQFWNLSNVIEFTSVRIEDFVFCVLRIVKAVGKFDGPN